MSNCQSENPAKRAKIEYKSESESKEIQIDENGHVACQYGEIIGSYRIGEKIGEGAFGRVVHATNVMTGQKAALKLMTNDKVKSKVAMAEIDALETIACRDPDDTSLCIKMLDWFNCDMYFCIAFPLLGMSVFDFLKENNYEPFPMDQVIHISHQLCSATDFLHRNGMIHTDLKLENMLFLNSTYTSIYDSEIDGYIRRIKCTNIRIIDFGLLTRDSETHLPVVATRYYRAPEIILQLGWGQPCDVWSIGCILVEIYVGNLLFDTHDDTEHLALMERTLGPIPSEVTSLSKTKHFTNGQLDWGGLDKKVEDYHLPLMEYKLVDLDDDDNLFDLIKKMFEYEPAKRISMSEALEHRFFNKLPKIDELNI